MSGAPPRVATAAELREFLASGKWPVRDNQKASDAAAVDNRPPKRHKYNVGPRHLRQLDGYTFDSVAERKRYEVLRAMEQDGEIFNLRVHPEWPLVVNGQPICEYRGDFIYQRFDGSSVVEDVKGGRATVTRAYEIKRKLMRACHGIEISEVEVK